MIDATKKHVCAEPLFASVMSVQYASLAKGIVTP